MNLHGMHGASQAYGPHANSQDHRCHWAHLRPEAFIERGPGHDANDNPEIKKPLTYLRKGIGDWFTCLDYPGMPATNNLAEQAIREHVMQRKIIGAFRSERGPKSYACIASLLEKWP